MTAISAIETNGLSKSYGRIEAVRGLSLSVKPHQITAFLGMNGAGKSTTIKMLLGMIRPSVGSIPWLHAGVFVAIAALLTMISIKVIQRRDF